MAEDPASEILFLKRLHFLRNSLENESTLNTNSVPFEIEKVNDSVESNIVSSTIDNIATSNYPTSEMGLYENKTNYSSTLF